ncbi:hypothetical protein EYF80_067133 [Liparis tanakae]|uniref:Uncharacterized protein n=1 Tax=Liparis tanakae TaxID=230148 RepID=A0A4Z2E2Z6_9TELE|nr:hypothetical protein EYF80_067133 [Liparis tanakae]
MAAALQRNHPVVTDGNYSSQNASLLGLDKPGLKGPPGRG